MYFTSGDGFQNISVYQPTFSIVTFKNTGTEYITSWKSKAVYDSKLIELNNNFLSNIKKYFEKKKKKIGI